MTRRFEGKSVLITGASSGIGAAVALEFAHQGARTALAARRTDRLEEVVARIEKDGGEAIALSCDVTDATAIQAAVTETVARFGCLDVVLANAGFGVSGPAHKLGTADFRRQFETNVFGVLDTLYAALPHLEASHGRFGVVGSVMGRLGMPASAPYCASKFAVVGLAESLYYDLADRGVSVTCINPGIVESEIRSVNNRGEYTGKPDPAPRWIVMAPDKAARQMVHALWKRKPEIVVTGHGKLIVFAARHLPRTTRAALRLATRNRIDKVQKAKRGGMAD